MQWGVYVISVGKIGRGGIAINLFFIGGEGNVRNGGHNATVLHENLGLFGFHLCGLLKYKLYFIKFKFNLYKYRLYFIKHKLYFKGAVGCRGFLLFAV